MSVVPELTSEPVPLELVPATDYVTSELADGPLSVQRSILPGGVRLLTETVPGTRAATIGLWVGVGSRDESCHQHGGAHFLEHLLFKGTRRHTALQIATAFDSVGGESNAATSKEATRYWAKVLDDDAPMAISTLTDMVTGSLLRSEDIDTERTVIIDELAASEDSPTEVTQEAFSLAVHGETPIGRPVGGTQATVADMSHDAIRELYRDHYSSDRLVVVAAGNVEHEQFRDVLLEGLEYSDWDLDPRAIPRSLQGRENGQSSLDLAPREITVHRDIEQAHLMVGGTWLTDADPARSASSVLFTILGGGVSSRLFQEIRERRGLAYTTYAAAVGYADTGLFGLYAGCAPSNVPEVEKIMWGEVEKLANGELDADELERSKGQIRGEIALGLEDSGARMSRLGYAELRGEFQSVDAVLHNVAIVEKEQVVDLAQQMLQTPRAKALVTNRG